LRWKAVAIGDACVVAWRQNELARSFPLDDPESFGFRPILLSSNSAAHKRAVDELHIEEGGALTGDVYFLLTDAIAQFSFSFAVPWERAESVLCVPEESDYFRAQIIPAPATCVFGVQEILDFIRTNVIYWAVSAEMSLNQENIVVEFIRVCR
jgi:hypothetical protein